MKNTYNKLTCLFGHHDYDEELTKDDGGYFIYLCKICKRSGYYKWSDGVEGWFDYDKEGNLVREKWSNGIEIRCDYDKKGNCVHSKWNEGEVWKDFDEEGNMIHRKWGDGHEDWGKYDEKGNIIDGTKRTQ